MNLSPTAASFVTHWGEMGARWGVNRSVAQIHALLFYFGRPMHAEEITDALGIARSNVSTSLRELQGWRLVKMVHLAGDRRDHFETSAQVWELLRTIVRERRLREIDPTIHALNQLLADPQMQREPADAKLRVKETAELLETLSAWSDEMLRLDAETLTKLLKLGAKIKRLLGRDAEPAAMRGDSGAVRSDEAAPRSEAAVVVRSEGRPVAVPPSGSDFDFVGPG